MTLRAAESAAARLPRSAEPIASYICLVGEICGSPIRSNGAPEARLAQPANPMRDTAASAFSYS
jgi:hypothetical protein